MQLDDTKSAGTVTLWVDGYRDIFSDFDPRPFAERTISDDFIAQIKKVSREKVGRIGVLKLLVPQGSQKEEHERIIKKRLQAYFTNIGEHLRGELRTTRRKGILFFLLGVLFMITATYIASLNPSVFHLRLLLTLLEPGGWFLFWTALDLLLSALGKKKSEYRFYSQMENTHIEFGAYK